MFQKIALYLSLAFLPLLVSCAPASHSQDIDLQKTLQEVLSGEPALLNPILSTDAYSSDVESLVYSGLFKINKQLELEPDLAESYTVSKSGKIYTFHLRKDVTWHDGEPFTAHDVKFTFDKVMDPATQTVRRSSFVIEGKPIKFTVIDDYTLRADLPEPFAPFLMSVSMEIIPKHIYEKEDINTSKRNRNPIGTGPYRFETWKPYQYILLTRNPHYYGPTHNIEHILFKIIPDTNTSLMALLKGEIDSAGIPPKDVPRFEKKPYLDLYEIEGLTYSFMAFNLKNPHFEDVRVRQAIVHAINREAIVKGILKGYGRVAHLPSSPVSWAYPPEEKITTFEYDPDKAQGLLEEAGYKRNPKTKILEKDGRPLKFTLLISQASSTAARNAEVMQAFLKEVGIEMKITQLEWQSFVAILNAPKDPKDFDAVMLAWSLGADPDGYSIWHSSQYPKGFNFIGYKNAKVDRLLTEGRREVIRDKRAEIYHELFLEIAKDAPYVFLVYPKSVYGVNTRIKGIDNPGPAGLFYPLEKISIHDPSSKSPSLKE